MTQLNGIEIEPLLKFKARTQEDPSAADRERTIVANWVGGAESRIEHEGTITHIGGDDQLNPMKMLLAAFAACDIDLISMHCTFMGLKVEKLSIEVTGRYNASAYIGIMDAPGSGFNHISYIVYLDVPDATPEQIEQLKQLCKHSSPVGDSLARAIPLQLGFEANKTM